MSAAAQQEPAPAWHPARLGSTLLSRRGLLLSAAASGLLAACGTTSAGSTVAASAGNPVKGGTLKLGSEVPPTAIDPVLSSDGTGLAAIQLVNEYLFWVEADGFLRPVLGLSSSVDASGLAWTVRLRQGVTFNDGTTKSFDGWAFVETDMSGDIASAVGGGIGSDSSS